MTDELMDARLRAAGDSWRAANATAADVSEATDEQLDLGASRAGHRTRWITIASAAVVAAALVVGGVVFARSGEHGQRSPGVEASPTSRLVGVTWKDERSAGTVVFTSDTARTFDGCSNALYRLTIDHAVLRTGKQPGDASTCTGTPEPPPGPARVAYDFAAANLARFYKILRGPSDWSVTGKTLRLTAATGATIELTTNGERAPMLVGTSWALERVQTDSELPGSYSSATLAIDSTGKFTANDLCNTVTGRAKVTTSTVDFGSTATTAIACLDPGFTPATTVIDKVLSGRATYAIRGNELIISNDGSNDLLIYLPAAPKTTDDDLTSLTSQPWTLTGTETTTNSGNSSSGSGGSAVSVTVLQLDGDNAFTLRHDCYTNKGEAVIGRGTIDFSHVTLKSAVPCASDTATGVKQREAAFVDTLLDGHVTWTIDGDQLTLTDKFGHAATFSEGNTEHLTTSTDAIKSTEWLVGSITDGVGANAPVSSTSAPVYLSILTSGTAAFGNKCNLMTMLITLGDGTITGDLSAGDRKCAATGLDSAQLATVHRIFTGKLTWSIADDQLMITKAGVGAITFTKYP